MSLCILHYRQLYQTLSPPPCLAGDGIAVEALPPTSVVLLPPEKLVLEIIATGRYLFTDWIRNANPQFISNDAPNFIHFGEIYYTENTAVEDLGEYVVDLVSAPDGSQEVGLSISFIVASPGME